MSRTTTTTTRLAPSVADYSNDDATRIARALNRIEDPFLRYLLAMLVETIADRMVARSDGNPITTLQKEDWL